MKTEKIIASVMSAALSITTILPVKLSEMNTYAFSLPDSSSPSAPKSDDDYVLGDVNEDNLIDAGDASEILAEYSILSTGGNGTFKESQKKAADVDNNSIIDSSDASLILSYYSYISTGGTLDIRAYINGQNPQPPATTTTAPTPVTTIVSSAVSTTTVKVTGVTTKPTVSTTVSGKITTTNTMTTATASTTDSVTTTAVSTTNSCTTETVITTVSVNPNKVSSISLDRSEIFIGLGYGDLSANVTMYPETASDKSEIWTSSDENIAVVDNEGYVIGKKEGDCKITVKSADNPDVSAEIIVHIVEPSTVKAIRLTRVEMSIQKGKEEYAAIVKMLPKSAPDQREKWSSSNEEIATVNSEGWLVAKKAGTCAVTVQSINNPNVLAVILVTVYDNEPPVTTTTTTEPNTTTTSSATTSTINVSEIRLSKYEMTVPVGKRNISIVTMLPYDAINKDEIWLSSDETIATVDKYGWIKGISVGECIVTVYSVSNPEVKAEIKVKIVDSGEETSNPDINFSHIVSEKSDSTNLAFCTPLPSDSNGRFVFDYVITDTDGKITTVSTSTILAPEMKEVITMLTAKTSEFTVTEYVTNLETNECAKIGTYKLCLNPRNAEATEEDIYFAFSIIGGIS